MHPCSLLISIPSPRLQRLIVEQAFVLAQELEAAADSAPDGQVIDRCESFLLGNGRDFLRRMLESTLQYPRRRSRKKGGAARICPCGAAGTAQGQRVQNGDDRAGRDRSLAYLFRVPEPVAWGLFVDRILGLEGFLTRQATRLVCLLGGQNSFAAAERLLAECCGWKVSDETDPPGLPGGIHADRRLPGRIAGRRRGLRRAAGDVEFQTDAAKVNTTGGWRDMKIGIFARRERGEPATSAELGRPRLAGADDPGRVRGDRVDRRLRPPLGPMGGPTGDRGTGPRSPSWATAPSGSGTRRRGSSAAAHQILDIYHAAEHISDAGKEPSAKERPPRNDWLEEAAACCCPTVGPGSATTSERR